MRPQTFEILSHCDQHRLLFRSRCPACGTKPMLELPDKRYREEHRAVVSVVAAILLGALLLGGSLWMLY